MARKIRLPSRPRPPVSMGTILNLEEFTSAQVHAVARVFETDTLYVIHRMFHRGGSADVHVYRRIGGQRLQSIPTETDIQIGKNVLRALRGTGFKGTCTVEIHYLQTYTRRV